MNVSGSLNNLSAVRATLGVQPQQAGDGTAAADGDAGRARPVHERGHIAQAVLQALQSVGLTPPAAGATPTDAAGTAAAAVSSPTMRQDMRHFMHALVVAMKDARPGDAAAGGSNDASATFTSGLSALISQVSSGNAPADLQSAFDKLASDTGATGTAALAAGATQPSLQAFLTQLQQNLGYAGTNTAATGSLLAAHG